MHSAGNFKQRQYCHLCWYSIPQTVKLKRIAGSTAKSSFPVPRGHIASASLPKACFVLYTARLLYITL